MEKKQLGEHIKWYGHLYGFGTVGMNQKREVKGFIVLESVFYLAFTTLDICSSNPTLMHISVALKLLSIASCLIFLGGMAFANPNNRDNRLMVLIMSVTLASDVFLLLTRQFIFGLILFVSVQLLYSIRIQKRLRIKSVCLKGAIFIASLLFFMQRLPHRFSYALMLALGAFYALLFTWNLIAVIVKRSEAIYDKRLFVVGLVLYALCDINVAIYNFPSFFDSNDVMVRLYNSSALAMWLFYLPGQVALTLSVRRKVDGTGG